MNQLFLDLDGVLADFDTHFRVLFKQDTRETADKELWSKINSAPSFFYDLPLCEGVRVFFLELVKFNPIILTACPRSDYHNVARQKKAWVKDKLKWGGLVLPIMGGANKGLFLQKEGDVLVDDMERNCKVWADEGGVAVLHTSIKQSRDFLRFYYSK